MGNGHHWESSLECPAIYISVATALDERFVRWVIFGAEEEGVPCREVPGNGITEAVTLAYSAAQGSHISVGVGIARGKIALQEAHMPPHRAVMVLDLDPNPEQIGRLIGGNAGRLVKRMPMRFQEDLLLEGNPGPQPAEAVKSAVIPGFFRADQELDSSMLKQIIERVINQQRGLI